MDKKLLLLFFVWICVSVVTSAQSSNTFKLLKNKVTAIINDSAYITTTFSSRPASFIRGYTKNDSVYLIYEHYELPDRLEECVYLFENNKLIFVNKKQCSDSLNNIHFNGCYQFENDNIIKQKVTGKEYEEPILEKADPYPDKSNIAFFYSFLAIKNKLLLFTPHSPNRTSE